VLSVGPVATARGSDLVTNRAWGIAWVAKLLVCKLKYLELKTSRFLTKVLAESRISFTVPNNLFWRRDEGSRYECRSSVTNVPF
jgi:hypothetical protein